MGRAQHGNIGRNPLATILQVMEAIGPRKHGVPDVFHFFCIVCRSTILNSVNLLYKLLEPDFLFSLSEKRYQGYFLS